jgi:Ribbon-helix-helix protein, copG family
MRTTIRIDDDLYRAVKERAASTRRTVAAVLEDAVRVGLDPPQRTSHARYEVRATGAGGLRPGIDLSSNSSVYDAVDEGLPLDALR